MDLEDGHMLNDRINETRDELTRARRLLHQRITETEDKLTRARTQLAKELKEQRKLLYVAAYDVDMMKTRVRSLQQVALVTSSAAFVVSCLALGLFWQIVQ